MLLALSLIFFLHNSNTGGINLISTLYGLRLVFYLVFLSSLLLLILWLSHNTIKELASTFHFSDEVNIKSCKTYFLL